MVDEKSAAGTGSADNADSLRVYEVGYHIVPTVKEDEIESVVSGIRSVIEKAGGNFIAEGAPSMIRLAYAIEGQEGGKRVEYDRAYYGWIKFEAEVAASKALEAALKGSRDVARFIIFRTVKEDTRAKYKAPQLREVKRTDTIRPTARRAEEPAAPVSEEDLEKALQDITE